MSSQNEITNLLRAWSHGDQSAFDRLVPLVDRELRRLAHSYMKKERVGHTLQTTALVNEAFLKLIQESNGEWQDRNQFYGLVARRMRQILTDYARQQLSQKRGARAEHADLNESVHLSDEQSTELVLLDEALKKLGKLNKRQAAVVEYRYFGGFTVDEVAQILGVAISTVEGDWRLARSWLKREISGS